MGEGEGERERGRALKISVDCLSNKGFLVVHAGVLCVVLGTVFLSLCGILMALLRNSLGYLFVDDKDVVAMVAVIAPIAAVYQFPDGILGTTNGVLRYRLGGLQTRLMKVCDEPTR